MTRSRSERDSGTTGDGRGCPTPRAINVADLFELVCDTVPERLALVAGDHRYTFAELDALANAMAASWLATGLEPHHRVAIWGRNSWQWVAAFLAAFKTRAAPVNVNFRYTADEARHVLADCGARLVLADREFVETASDAVRDLPGVASVRRLDEDRPLHPSTARPAPNRTGNERYLLYTGGTTGLPKGVEWRVEDILHAAIFTIIRPADPPQSAEQMPQLIYPRSIAHLVLAPMMHGNGQWNALAALLSGGTLVLWCGRRLDADAAWDLAEREGAAKVAIVGDAMARPLLDALGTRHRDLSALRVISSGGAVLSPSFADRLREQLTEVRVIDGFGASETGGNGQVIGWNQGQARFRMGPDTAVLDDDLVPVPAGSGRVGKLARTGRLPLGYLGDAARTEEVFRTDATGRRWALLGDAAVPEADGTVTVLGRGTTCINTGGEKVFPDEVERVLKSFSWVHDALVIGMPDPGYGEQIVALVVPASGQRIDLDRLRRDGAAVLAGYKLPRRMVEVGAIERSPAGKPDYAWARAVAGARSDARRSVIGIEALGRNTQEGNPLG